MDGSFGFPSTQQWPTGGLFESPEVQTARSQAFESLQRLSNQLRDASHHVEALSRAISRPNLPNGSPIAAGASSKSAPANQDSDDGLSPAEKKKMSKRAKKMARKAADPNAPKRPPSAYLVFQNEVRGDMRKRHPDLPYGELLGKVSEAWKALPEADKKIYQDNTDEEMRKWKEEKETREGNAGAAAAGGEADELADEDNDDEEAGDATTAEAQLLADAVSKEKTKKKPGRKSKATLEAEQASPATPAKAAAAAADESTISASGKKRKGEADKDKKKKSKK